MSGGHWDYKQFWIAEMAEDIQELIDQNGKEKTKEELKDENWHDSDWYEKYPEDLKHQEYSPEVIEKFKEGVEAIKKAHTYVQRIDWLLSGDDGEDSFLKRLKKELDEKK